MQIVAKTPRELVDVLQAVILIVLVAVPVIARAVGGRGEKQYEQATQQITTSYVESLRS